MNRLRTMLVLVGCALLSSPAVAQSTKIIDPSTGLAVFSSANPAPVTVVSGSSVPTGTAGSPSASVVSVQGVASGTVLPVGGNVANAATDSGNPVKIGGVYLSNPSGAAVATTQRVDQRMTSWGSALTTWTGSGLGVSSADNSITGVSFGLDVTNLSAGLFAGVMNFASNGSGNTFYSRGDANGLVVQPAISATFWNYAAAASGIVSSTADVAVKAAAGASVRNFVCSIDISHDVLSAVSEIVIKDGSTVVWRGKLSTAVADVAGGAGKLSFAPCLRGTANTAVNVAMITSVTGGVYVNLTGYTGS